MFSSGDGGCSKRFFTLVTLVRKLETMLRIRSPKTCSRSAPMIDAESTSEPELSFFRSNELRKEIELPFELSVPSGLNDDLEQ